MVQQKFLPRKAVADNFYVRNSSNVCKLIVGIVASQLYSFSKCHEMPTGFYRRSEYDYETDQFKARNNKTINYEMDFCPSIKKKTRV